MNKPYIYRNLIIATGKYYIGRHNGTDPYYKGSGVDYRKDYKLYVKDQKQDLITEILEYCSLENLHLREEYYLEQVDAMNNPLYYNKSNKSFGGGKRSEEQLQRMREGSKGQNLGKIHSQETKDKRSKSLKGKNLGKLKSNECKEKMSLAKKGKPLSYTKTQENIFKQAQSNVKINKPIMCFNMDGKLLQIYNNASEIIHLLFKPLNIKLTTGDIHANCRGKQLTCKGFIFQFKDDNQISSILEKIANDIKRHNHKKIYQLDLNDNFIKEWDSGYEIIKNLFPHLSTTSGGDIKKCCIGKQKTAYGFKWSYEKPLNFIVLPKKVLYKQKLIEKKYFLTKNLDELEIYSDYLYKWVRDNYNIFPYELMKKDEKNINVIKDYIKSYDVSKVINNNIFNNTCSSEGNWFLKSRFKSFWKSSYNNSINPFDLWNNEKFIKNIIRYRIGINNTRETFDFSLHQIIKGMSATRNTISFFKPILASSIYKYFLGDISNPVVIDPCAGFGGRMLGFMSTYPKGTYIGIEPNIETYNELLDLSKEIGGNIHLFNCKAEDYKYSKECDLTFTSIPYYDKEIYSNNIISTYNNEEDWVDKFIKNGILTFNKCLINLPENLFYSLKQQTKDIFYLKNGVASHLNKNQKEKIEIIAKLY